MEHAIGIDLGGTKTRVALVNDEGAVLKQTRIPTRPAGTYSQVAEDIAHAIAEMGKGIGHLRIGVGVAGQVNEKTGIIYFSPNLKWHNAPLAEELSRLTHLPVSLTNDVRAATIGEWVLGAGTGCQDLVCLFFGTGIGGGIVSGGALLKGASNSCGELGHITVDYKGPLCSCGNYGCFEALCSGWALARTAQALAFDFPESLILKRAEGRPDAIDAKAVIAAAKESDPLALRVMEDFFEASAAGCGSILNAFNPKKLIFGGGIIDGNPELMERIVERINKHALNTPFRAATFATAELGKEAGAVGAALAILKGYL